MSRNFELLLQAGAVGHYFHGIESDVVDKTPASAESRYRVPHNDEFAQLVRRVFLNARHSSIRSLMISGTSCGQPAEACAQIGRSLASLVDAGVCLVDANFAHPSLHERFGDDNVAGLADALLLSKSPKAFARQIEHSNLYFMPAGMAATNRTISEADLSANLDFLKREFDYLVVAAPPADDGRHLNAIGRVCDGALLVLEGGGVPLNVMLKIKRQFDASDIALFGVVLNGPADLRHPSSTITPGR